MSTSEKPRDVSGVELLMNNHQGHKAEIDTREDIFGDVYSLGNLSYSLPLSIYLFYLFIFSIYRSYLHIYIYLKIYYYI